MTGKGRLLTMCGLALAAGAGALLTYLLVKPSTATPPTGPSTFLAKFSAAAAVSQAFPGAVVKESEGGELREFHTSPPPGVRLVDYTLVLKTGVADDAAFMKARLALNPVVAELRRQINAVGGTVSVPGLWTTEFSVYHTELVYTLGAARGCIDLRLVRVDRPDADLVIILRLVEIH